MFKGKVNRKSEVGIFEILQRMFCGSKVLALFRGSKVLALFHSSEVPALFCGSKVPALFRGSEVPAFEAVRCQLCVSLHALSSKVLALSCPYSGSWFAHARSSIPTSFV